MKLTKSKLKQIIKEELYVIMGGMDHEENFVSRRGFGQGSPADPQGFSMKRDVYLEENEDTKESCEAHGGKWDEASGCEEYS